MLGLLRSGSSLYRFRSEGLRTYRWPDPRGCRLVPDGLGSAAAGEYHPHDDGHPPHPQGRSPRPRRRPPEIKKQDENYYF